MSKKRYKGDSDTPFEETVSQSVRDADEQLFGTIDKTDLPVSGRIVSKPVSINEIWADSFQPRRAVPASLQLHWNGNPETAIPLLNDWYVSVTNKHGYKFDPEQLIKGEGDGISIDGAPATVKGYVELCNLAASIYAEGQINPISIIEYDGHYLIETGERRWLAHHLLYRYIGDDYSKILAQEVKSSKGYVWRQAYENNSRQSLNAIGLARQFAILLMDAKRERDDTFYHEPRKMVKIGNTDRRFYAQVANGKEHRIPRGMGARFEAAMGINTGQMRRYRKLLSLSSDEEINDVLWFTADVEDWKEGLMRKISEMQLDIVREILAKDDWSKEDFIHYSVPIGTVSPEDEDAYTAPRGTVSPDETDSPTVPSDPNWSKNAGGGRITYGDTVSAPNGLLGTVIGPNAENNKMVDVKHPNGISGVYFPSTLTLRETPDSPPRHLERESGGEVSSSDNPDSQPLTEYYDEPKKSPFGESHVVASNRGNRDINATGNTARPNQPDYSGNAQEYKDQKNQREAQHAADKAQRSVSKMISPQWDEILSLLFRIAELRGDTEAATRINEVRSITRSQCMLWKADPEQYGLHDMLDSYFQDIEALTDSVKEDFGMYLTRIEEEINN